MAVHVRYISLYISLSSSAKQRHETQAAQAQNMRSYILFFFYFYANIQRNVTSDIYYYLRIELDHAKRDSRLAAYGGVLLQRLEGFESIKLCMGTQRFCR